MASQGERRNLSDFDVQLAIEQAKIEAAEQGAYREREAIIQYLHRQGGRGAWTVIGDIEAGYHNRAPSSTHQVTDEPPWTLNTDIEAGLHLVRP